MPKIIENLEGKLLAEAKKQLFEAGYGTMTVRSVAKACGVGVGTVYNYFSSKDDMIARVMLKDLDHCVAVIRSVKQESDCVLPVVRCIYDQLVLYARQHSGMFRNRNEAAAFMGSFDAYREMLRSQIAQIIREYCESDFASEFVSEALLTWTMAQKTFEEIYGMVEKVFVVPSGNL